MLNINNNNNNMAEKRRNVRVPVSINAKARRLYPDKEEALHVPETDDPDADGNSMPEDDLTDNWARYPDIASFTDFMIKIEDESDPLISYFAESMIKIGEKLDLIIEKLNGESEDRRIPVKRTIDMSGTGVSLLVEEPVKEGTCLEISLQIPGFPLGWYTTRGRVVHAAAVKRHEKGDFNIGVRYEEINIKDRERLVAFTFAQQRKNIRKSQ